MSGENTINIQVTPGELRALLGLHQRILNDRIEWCQSGETMNLGQILDRINELSGLHDSIVEADAKAEPVEEAA